MATTIYDERTLALDDHEECTRVKSGCFPLPICKCLPAACFFVPDTLRVVQDWTHLSIATAVIILLVEGILSIVALCSPTEAFTGANIYGSREVLYLVMLGLVLPWAIPVLAQFDERVTDKRQRLQSQKQELTQAYHQFISQMNDFLEKSLEYNTNMAETLFQGKYRTLTRWLRHVKTTFPVVFAGSTTEHAELVKQFRLLCVRWFNSLRECSIDPVSQPWIIMETADLEQFRNVPDIANYCLSKLENAPRVDVDIQNCRNEGRKMITQNGEEAKRLSTGNVGKKLDDQFKKMKFEQDAQTSRSACWPSWVRCCVFSVDCCAPSPHSEDGYPRRVGFLCCMLEFMGQSQLALLFALVLSLGMAGLHFYKLISFEPETDNDSIDDNGHKFPVWFIVEECVTALFTLCLFWVIVRFEDIDICAQLDRETSLLKGNTEKVKEQDETMRVFWNNVQDINGVWLYRTIPMLDLLESVSHKLEDGKPEDIRKYMAIANERLQELENRLGPIQVWKGDRMSDEERKRIASNIKVVHQQRGLPQILDGLKALNKGNVGELKKLPGYDSNSCGGGALWTGATKPIPGTSSSSLPNNGKPQFAAAGRSIEMSMMGQKTAPAMHKKPTTMTMARDPTGKPTAERTVDDEGYLPMLV